MKKILVTGAAGSIGNLVLKYLLSEGKYEITAVELKNKQTYKVLKKYHRRMNVIYGDATDPVLIDSLIKDHDCVIHLATIKPSISILNKNISEKIDYKTTENIVRAITFYNPKCFLIFPSTTNVYGNKFKEITSSTKISIQNRDYHTTTKIQCEKLIKDKLQNYIIYRIPTVLSDIKKNNMTYNITLNTTLETITAQDAAYGLVKTIDHQKELNKKIYNLSGGENCVTEYRKLLISLLKLRGLNKEYLWALLLLEKNTFGHTYVGSNKLDKILNYKNDSIDSYLMRSKRQTKNLFKVKKVLAKPYIYILSRKLK